MNLKALRYSLHEKAQGILIQFPRHSVIRIISYNGYEAEYIYNQLYYPDNYNSIDVYLTKEHKNVLKNNR